jgi:hypothetical protein
MEAKAKIRFAGIGVLHNVYFENDANSFGNQFFSGDSAESMAFSIRSNPGLF